MNRVATELGVAVARLLLRRASGVRLLMWCGVLAGCVLFAMRNVTLWLPVMEIGCIMALLTAWPKAQQGFRRRALVNAAILIASIAVSLVLCEIVARL